MKILLIDNYDSFTYNLYHYLSSLKCKVDVYRNDRIKIEQIKKKQYHTIKRNNTKQNKTKHNKTKQNNTHTKQN